MAGQSKRRNKGSSRGKQNLPSDPKTPKGIADKTKTGLHMGRGLKAGSTTFGKATAKKRTGAAKRSKLKWPD